jgi:hypothetical protein
VAADLAIVRMMDRVLGRRRCLGAGGGPQAANRGTASRQDDRRRMSRPVAAFGTN